MHIETNMQLKNKYVPLIIFLFNDSDFYSQLLLEQIFKGRRSRHTTLLDALDVLAALDALDVLVALDALDDLDALERIKRHL